MPDPKMVVSAFTHTGKGMDFHPLYLLSSACPGRTILVPWIRAPNAGPYVDDTERLGQ